jgi:hypothetical protein
MRPEPTTTQRLASLLLGTDLHDWIGERKSHPYKPSWTAIAADLKDATNGEVSVTGEAIRRWYVETTPEPQDAA